MFKAFATDKQGKPLYILGLTATNVERMNAGDPVLVDLSELNKVGLHPGRVIIYTGESEQAMAADLGDFVGPDTRITVDPRLQDHD